MKSRTSICSGLRRLLTRLAFWFRYRSLKSKFTLVTCTLFLITIFILHFLLLPSFTGAYNDECYLSDKKLNELRQLILVSAKLMEKYNMIYWLDFGTLLGAVKFGDVLPWDGDADISSIYNKQFNPSEMNAEFNNYGIHRNGLVALVNHTQLDYYRWSVTDGVFNGVKTKILKTYYPKWILDTDSIFIKFEHNRETLPMSWVVPTTKIEFLGVPVAVPGQYKRVLEARYPMTYKYNIFTPYKWKCWLPCWLTGDKKCKNYFLKKVKH